MEYTWKCDLNCPIFLHQNIFCLPLCTVTNVNEKADWTFRRCFRSGLYDRLCIYTKGVPHKKVRFSDIPKGPRALLQNFCLGEIVQLLSGLYLGSVPLGNGVTFFEELFMHFICPPPKKNSYKNMIRDGIKGDLFAFQSSE
ncbi:hypothetical protein XENTR_v10020695 [Xenopus tropicalis]|nr:hypothetical protein XENTR_v10020695 [Xenopus tropicalis]